MASGVYVIENSLNGKRYVGSAANLGNRWTKHLLYLRRGTHHSPHLQNSWSKYGEGAFVFLPIMHCARDRLIQYEQMAMDALSPEYNVCKVAGSCRGVVRSASFRQKLGDRQRGKPVSAETREKISRALAGRMAGVPLAADHKKKLSDTAKANAWGKGRHLFVALAEAKRGIPRPSDVREKIGRSLGRFTEEQVRAIRAEWESGVMQKVIAQKYGIASAYVSEIVNRRKYAWVN